ncbi:hypothetical protein KJ810_02835 [Patescibacteria group bacterium]|nr:hypothetical protein [Patescibacteria group bacterium]
MMAVFLAIGLLMIPMLATAAENSYYMASISATIPTTTTLDANAGAEGLGLTSFSAAYMNDGAITSTAGFVINSSASICLRAKGSRNYTGVLPSASALMVNSYVGLMSMSDFDVTAILAGATGTCTWHPLRC